MSKVISAYDLLLADPLQGMTQFDLVHLDNIEKVHAVLGMLGFDTNKAIHAFAAQHRTLTNEVKIGYMFAGEHNFAREHIKGPYSTLEDVMLAAQAQDKSLYEELYAMNSRCSGYGGDHALDENVPGREDAEYKDEEIKIANQIAQLEDLLYHIRGSQQNPDGSYKTLEEYNNPKPAEKLRKKYKKRKSKEGSVDE
jgi:hypothetical protein